jgi:hypothetical protein
MNHSVENGKTLCGAPLTSGSGNVEITCGPCRTLVPAGISKMVAKSDVESGPSVFLGEYKYDDGMGWYKFLGANGEIFWAGLDVVDHFWITDEDGDDGGIVR